MARTLEAQLKLKAVDQTGRALASVSRGLSNIDRKAAMLNRTQVALGRASAMASTALSGVLAPAVAGYAAYSAYRRFGEVERSMTRIGITADASREQMNKAGASMTRLAYDVALPLDEVRGGLDSLTSAGRNLSESMTLLPAVARTAQASGSAVSDVADTAVAVGDSFRIASTQMEHAFDIMATGGKIGRFELKNLAEELPSLAPAFAAVGESGVEGLTKAVAMLQIIREQSGSSAEAATAMKNVLQKMESSETVNRFADFGIDLRKELAKARKEGKNVLDTFLRLGAEATRGDLSKVPLLFADAQLQQGMRALLTNLPRVQAMMDEIRVSAPGTVGRDLERVLEDAQTSVDRIKNSADAAAMSVGNLFEAFGASTAISETAEDIEQLAEAVKRLRDGNLTGAAEKALQVVGRTSVDAAYTDEYRRASGGREPSTEQVRERKPLLAPFWRGTTEEADIAAARQAARDQVRDAGGLSASEALQRMDAGEAEVKAARDAVTAAQEKIAQAPGKAEKRAAELALDAARGEQAAVERRAATARAQAGARGARDMVGLEGGLEEAEERRRARRKEGDSYGADRDRLRALRSERAEFTAAAIENGFGEKIDREIDEIMRRRAAGEVRRAPFAATPAAERSDFALPPRRGQAPSDADWQPVPSPRQRPGEARPSVGRVQQYPARPTAAAAPVTEPPAPSRASLFDMEYPSTPAPVAAPSPDAPRRPVVEPVAPRRASVFDVEYPLASAAAPVATPSSDAPRRPVVEPAAPRRASMFGVEHDPAPVAVPESREDPGLDRRQQQVDNLIAAYRRLEEQTDALPEAPASGGDPMAAVRGQIEAQKFQTMNLLRQLGGDAAESFVEGIRSGATSRIELPKPEPVDLTAVGAETMRSFGSGLDGEMGSVRAKVSAFVAEIRGMLSFTASPNINATVNTTERRRVTPVNADVGDSGKAFD